MVCFALLGFGVLNILWGSLLSEKVCIYSTSSELQLSRTTGNTWFLALGAALCVYSALMFVILVAKLKSKENCKSLTICFKVLQLFIFLFVTGWNSYGK